MVSLWIGCGAGGDDPSRAPPTVECTLIGCWSGASYEGGFSLGGADANSLELTTCFNGTCDKTPIRFSGKDASCSSATRPLCWLSLATADSVQVRLTVSPPAGVSEASLMNGDHYEARIGLSGQAPLLQLDARATYTTFQPNGPMCGPTCKSTRLVAVP
jgi:hypothetical protein